VPLTRILLPRLDVHDLNRTDVEGRTDGALPGSREGREELVRLLIAWDGINADKNDHEMGRSYSMDDHPGDHYERAPLSWVSMNGHVGVFKLLLERGDVDVNSQTEDCLTPLSLAVLKGHTAVVQFLLGLQGVNINPRSLT
jgi:hypothetical protein